MREEESTCATATATRIIKPNQDSTSFSQQAGALAIKRASGQWRISVGGVARPARPAGGRLLELPQTW